MLPLIALLIVVVIAIWLAFVIIKWLFILAVVAAIVWLVFFLGRRRA